MTVRADIHTHRSRMRSAVISATKSRMAAAHSPACVSSTKCPPVVHVHVDTIQFTRVRHDLVQLVERVVAPPQQQTRRLIRPVILRQLVESGDVIRIVPEQPELRFHIARPHHSRPIQMPGLGWMQLAHPIREAAQVLVSSALEVQPFG